MMALKVARNHDPEATESPGAFSRFIEEAQITGQLEHPGIVPVHELGLAANGRVYFTMRLVKGRTLREIYDLVHTSAEGWNTTRALHVLLKVCEAVSYAHDKGVIHRDLKPANVMVGRYGEVYVMDWGLARALGTPKTRAEEERAAKVSKVVTNRARNREGDTDSAVDTQEGEILGTPVYMPPEQALGHIDELGPPSDVYAVGAMLYHLLSSKLPYVEAGERPSPFTVVERVLAGPPTSLAKISDAPSELVAICEKAMARNPEVRYRTMGELGEDLRAFLEERVVRAYQVGPWAETRKWMRRNQALAASLVAGIVAVTALAGLVVRNFNRVSARNSDTASPITAMDVADRRVGELLERAERGDALALEDLESALAELEKLHADRARQVRDRLEKARAKR
jgi:serine/threonine-protein kinase